MATKSERTALIFLSAVALAGALVRADHALRTANEPSGAAAAALATQRRAVDSATRAHGTPAAGGRGATRQRSKAPPRAQTRTLTDKQPTVPAPKAPAPVFPIDVDQASASDLEALPRIGPALARRIVSERTARGPFGTLAALDKRVPGIGPALAKAIQPLVTFSGR